MKLTNKGAMFGLDARIALAIFGALSVISGAALYSAIQQSRVVATVTELEEIGKAFDAYYLDRGEMMQQHATVKYALYTGELVSNSENSDNWKGPYTSLEWGSTVSLKSAVNSPTTVHLQYRQSTDWGGVEGTDTAPPTECTAAPCYIWINTFSAPTTLAHSVDEYVDGSRDNKTGRVRVWDYTVGASAGKSNIYYQYAVAPVQP